MNLDEKLREILLGPTSTDEAVDLVKQAFADDEDFQRMRQDMANLHANMKQEAIRLGLTPTPTDKLMTGAAWYERYQAELQGKAVTTPDLAARVAVADTFSICDEAAQRAAGIGEE